MDERKAEDLARRLAAALRGAELYAPAHPIVRRGMDALAAAVTDAVQAAQTMVIGFLGDEVVVDAVRLPRGTASLTSFARDLREREIDKITFSRGVTPDEIRAFVAALADRKSPVAVAERLTQRGVRHISLGKIAI